MIRRISFLLLLSLTFFAAASVASAGDYRETEVIERTIPLSAGGMLTLENLNGGIEVRSWGREEIQLIATKKANADSREEALERLSRTEIVIDQSSGRVDIRTEYPRRGMWRGKRGSASVQYELTVPDVVDLELSTTNGGIRVEDVDGRHEISSTNGGLKLLGLRGSVNASTTNGGIQAELFEYNGEDDLKISTTNGSIRLSVPSNVRARVRARTTNGRIKSDFSLPMDRRRRSVDADINGGGALIRLTTTNGSISLLEAR